MTAGIERAAARLDAILLGKTRQVRLSLCCLLAGGHLLIEDIPGMGKTTLSHALAGVLGLSYNRIQFTSDLLPADVLGFSTYDREAGSMLFHPGPIFSQIILADEINRASPRTQSALLEAMEERQVSIEGETRPLPSPFFVIATQNPLDQGGTFPLPESQLDRFLMCLQLGYPHASAERELLLGVDRRQMTAELQPELNHEELMQLQQAVQEVTVSSNLLDYLQRILTFSRELPGVRYGLSPRAGLGLLRAARAWALMEGRDYVLPEDLQLVLPNVVEHRLVRDNRDSGLAVARQILDQVPVIQ
ncbi:MAG: MoxR family ATPase [Halomonadaceae bacterium]|nr:MAG: MoxR family ATPase [Halomonadaceae bacterium]